MNLARIIDFAEIDSLRNQLGRIVCTSGGYDPIHPGHLSVISESRKFGDTMVVIVNGDSFLTAKKGKPFQDLETRCNIISYIRGVDFVIPFEIENDQTVQEALRQLKPHVFTKGGDRCSLETIPESNICKQLGITIEMGIGKPKNWSSSEFLTRWNSK